MSERPDFIDARVRSSGEVRTLVRELHRMLAIDQAIYARMRPDRRTEQWRRISALETMISEAGAYFVALRESGR